MDSQPQTLHSINPGPGRTIALLMALLLCLVMHGCGTTPDQDQATSAPLASQPKALPEQDRQAYETALAMVETDTRQTRKILQRLAKRHPDHVGVWINLATSQFELNEDEDAEMSLEQAMGLNGNLPEIYNLRGLLALEGHDFQAAERDFLHALKLRKNFALAHYNLGLIYDIYRQDIETALHHYDAYLAHFPEDADTAAWAEQLRHSLNPR